MPRKAPRAGESQGRLFNDYREAPQTGQPSSIAGSRGDRRQQTALGEPPLIEYYTARETERHPSGIHRLAERTVSAGSSIASFSCGKKATTRFPVTFPICRPPCADTTRSPATCLGAERDGFRVPAYLGKKLRMASMMELLREYGPFQLHMFRTKSKVIIPHSSSKTAVTMMRTFHKVPQGASTPIIAAA